MSEETNGDHAESQALDLRRDGTIGIELFDGSDVTLKRPTLRQYERWKLKLNDIADHALRSRTADARAGEADMEDEALDDAERLLRANERRRAFEDQSLTDSLEWWGEVFDGLADRVPTEDEMPPWLVYGETVLATILAHWRGVPLALGPRSNKPNASKKARS